MALNTNAASESASDKAPQVATDGAGSWVAAWRSNDDMGGTIGADDDILVALSSPERPPVPVMHPSLLGALALFILAAGMGSLRTRGSARRMRPV